MVCAVVVAAGVAASAQGLHELNVPALPGADSRPIAIVNARVIDGIADEPVENSTILIRRGLIEAVGPAGSVDIPAGAERFDATGHTVTPGLIDAHFHSVNDNPLLARFLSNGVTTIREPGHPFRFYQSLDFAEGPLPRCFLVGAHLDGYPPVWPQQAVIVRGPDHARRVVNEHVDRGASGIKTYFRLPLAYYPAVVEAAHERGVYVTAHIELVAADDAINAGVDGIEHITSFGPAMAEPGAAAAYYASVLGENEARGDLRYRMWADLDLDSPRAKRMIDMVVERGTIVCPTLAVFERRDGDRDTRDYHVRGFENMLRFTGMLHEAGATLVIGSHTWVRHAEMGLSYQRELEMFVEAGMTPMEAIRAGTSVNARYFRTDDRIGAIAAGRQADLVVVEGDPSQDIRAMYDVRRVMLAGRWVEGD